MKVSIGSLVGEYKIDIPGNGIDRRGIDVIQKKLREWGLDEILDDVPLPPSKTEIWQWDWKVGGKGEYVGALPKRIGKLIWQTKGVKLTPEQLSILGNIGTAYSNQRHKYWFDIVDHADWQRSDFGQPHDCCFWSCHSSAKDMILENGGGAIRFFTDEHYTTDNGFARAWLAPWRDCWIVFNGYGLETLAIARILAAHLNHAYYRRIDLSNHDARDGELWINGGTAYLVGPQESVLKWSFIDLQWEGIEVYECEICNGHLDPADHFHDPHGHDLCEVCYEDNCFYCVNCNECCWLNEGFTNPDGDSLCKECWEEDYLGREIDGKPLGSSGVHVFSAPEAIANPLDRD